MSIPHQPDPVLNMAHFMKDMEETMKFLQGNTDDMALESTAPDSSWITGNQQTTGIDNAADYDILAPSDTLVDTELSDLADLKPSVSPQPSSTNVFECQWYDVVSGQICGHIYDNQSELQEHCKAAHTRPLAKESGGFCCQWSDCDRKGTPFNQKSKLERHLQTHTGFKPVKCDICGLQLSAKQALEQHMRTHTGEKPWKCPYCPWACRQQSALTMHVRTHTGYKPLECEICGMAFSESSNLTKHRTSHLAKGTFVCQECGKDFKRLDQLRRHMKTHQDKPSKKRRRRDSDVVTRLTALPTPDTP
jgi:uncharacterized Zn-finger protein